MKRITPATSLLLLLCMLVGCAGNGDAKELNMDSLATDLINSDSFSDILSPIEDAVAAAIYVVDEADIEDCRVFCSTGATAEEVAVFKAKDEAAAGRILDAAKARIEAQKQAYSGYAPEEVPKLDSAIVRQSGVYVVYVVPADAAAAKKVADKHI